MKRAPRHHQEKDHGLYKIGLLAKLTGLGVPAIRNWERRYQLLRPVRTEGGHRLYTASDLATLVRVQELSKEGHSIGEIARLGRDALLASQSARTVDAEPPAHEATSAGIAGPVLDAAVARAALEAIPHAVIVTDPEGRTRWINTGVVELCGYTLHDLVGRKPGSVLQGPDTDPAAVQRMAKALAARRPCSEELANYDSRNRKYIAAIDIAPLWVEGTLHGFIGVARDLTKDAAPHGLAAPPRSS